jgi:hypothetical protein
MAEMKFRCPNCKKFLLNWDDMKAFSHSQVCPRCEGIVSINKPGAGSGTTRTESWSRPAVKSKDIKMPL